MASEPSDTPQLKYMRNTELRDHLTDLVGIDTDRYTPGGDRRRKLSKAEVRQVADALDVAPEETVTLAEYYRLVCSAADVEYNATAGNQSGLGRRQLKAIIHTLEEVEFDGN